MKKIALIALCLFISGCSVSGGKTPSGSLNEIGITNFICETIKWHQYWFEKWDKKLINAYTKHGKMDLKVISAHSKSDNKTNLEVYNAELNCIFYLTEENDFLYLQRIEEDADLKPVGKNVKDYFAERYNSSTEKKLVMSGVCNDFVDMDKNVVLDEAKRNITKGIIQDFIENTKTFEKIPPKLKEMIKKGDRLTVYAGFFYNNYPDIVLFVKEVPLLVRVTKDSENNILMNNVIFKNKTSSYNYAVNKILTKGNQFIWKNNEVE